MLRLVIGTGLLLMAVGFGAAGWQYWQGLPGSAPVTESGESAPSTGVWLISPTGAIVPEEIGRAYLVQDRLVPERMARITLTAALESLLLAGEKLPAAPYLEVLADIRAPRLGQALCPVLTNDLAAACSVHSARVVPDSVDPVRGDGRFTLELAFRQDGGEAALPDLAAHVLRRETVGTDPVARPLPASAEAALADLVDAAASACAPEDRAGTCRVLGLTLDWTPAALGQSEARIGWLGPLPEGMVSLSPITPPPEG